MRLCVCVRVCVLVNHVIYNDTGIPENRLIKNPGTFFPCMWTIPPVCSGFMSTAWMTRRCETVACQQSPLQWRKRGKRAGKCPFHWNRLYVCMRYTLVVGIMLKWFLVIRSISVCRYLVWYQSVKSRHFLDGVVMGVATSWGRILFPYLDVAVVSLNRFVYLWLIGMYYQICTNVYPSFKQSIGGANPSALAKVKRLGLFWISQWWMGGKCMN